MKLIITGVEEIKEFFDRKRDYTKVLARFIKDLQGYAREVTHVWTGSWRGAHETSVMTNQAELFIDPGATNIETGTPVEVYAGIWEARGGSLDVYGRIVGAVSLSELEEGIAAEVLL